MDQDVALIRQRLTTPRAAGIAGIVFSAISIVGHVLIMHSIPRSPLGSAIQFARHAKTVSLVLYLVPFAGIAFLWFIGVVRDRLGNLEDRFFATVFLGSGLLYIAMLFVFAAITGGLLMALRSGTESILQSGVYDVARATAHQVLNVYAIKMAGVFMISVSTTRVRLRIGPRWLAFLGYLLAVVLLLSIAEFEWASLVFPLWAFLISVSILIERFSGPLNSEPGSISTVS
jgi:hypothetical protein